MAQIPITGISDDFQVPGIYVEARFGQGNITRGAKRRETLYVLPMIAGSTWTANSLYKITSESDALNGAGAGSPMHVAIKEHLAVNRNDSICAIPYVVTGTQADGYVDITGTATASGVVAITIAGRKIPIGFRTGETGATIAARVESICESIQDIPVSGSTSSTKVTFAAKVPGSIANSIVVSASVTPSCGISVATKAGGFGGGTSSDEVTALTAALATVANLRKYYTVQAQTDADSIAALASHISLKSLPDPGLRSYGLSMVVGTKEEAEAQGETTNFERITIAFQNGAPDWHVKSLANLAALVQLKFNTNSQTNLTGYRGPDWHVSASAPADILSNQEINSLINAGITVINSDSSGSYIVSLRTSKHKTNGNLDFRAAHVNKISVVDEWLDEAIQNIGGKYGAGWAIKDDVLLENGQVDPNQDIPENTIVPSMISKRMAALVRKYGQAGKLQDVDRTIQSIKCVRGDATSRIEAGIELHVVDPFEQLTIRADEVSAG